MLWKGIWLHFFMNQGRLRKLDFPKKDILETYYNFFARKTHYSQFLTSCNACNACAVQIKHGINKLLKKTVLEHMGYWQIG